MSTKLLCLTSIAALCAGMIQAQDMNFNRIASFETTRNMAEGEDTLRTSSAEIIAASEDGMTLVYTDSPLGVIGMIDITDPTNPQPLGNIEIEGGEPTAVAVTGGTAYVGVDTSESFTNPSGFLKAIDMETGEELGRCDLGGQPDSVAVSPDGSFVSVAIENERDEEAGDGRVGQMPAGFLAMAQTGHGGLDCDTVQQIEMTGLAEIAPADPEPEFVDINDAGETVVTMQENNHVAVVSREGEVISSFTAGSVDLTEVDATEDDALDFSESLSDVVREPDAINWIDNDHFAMANEGDMDGGSRGWSIFRKDGTLVYDSGASFEHALIAIGHYPESRSENKGVEPESIEFGIFDGTPMVFVGSERGSAVGVYDVTDPKAPKLRQILPSGIGPEGYVALPERNLLISANEEDLGEDGGPRAHVMIYEYAEGAAQYPMLTSAGAAEPIGWGAISGMTDAGNGMVAAVVDSFYAGQPRILMIDPSQQPARITGAIDVTRDGEPAQSMDMEGIVRDGEGGFWIANEGDREGGIPHAIYRVDAEGAIHEEVMLPERLLENSDSHGLEGITMDDQGRLWMAVQFPWGDDPENMAKLLSYDPAAGEWSGVLYPLESAQTGWVGLSEITYHDGALYMVERDNQFGTNARTKQITRVALEGLDPAGLDGELPQVSKDVVRDLIPDLRQLKGFVQDKVEGLAIMDDGTAWVSTDNDGVDDSSGETLFWQIKL